MQNADSVGFNLTLWCDRSFESSRRDDSNEWSHHRVRMRNNEVGVLNSSFISVALLFYQEQFNVQPPTQDP